MLIEQPIDWDLTIYQLCIHKLECLKSVKGNKFSPENVFIKRKLNLITIVVRASHRMKLKKN